MKLTSNDLLELKIIDEIILEPSGGAHRDRDKILINLKKSISKNLTELTTMSKQEIINHRKNKFLNIGREEALSNTTLSSDKLFNNKVSKFFDVKNKMIEKKNYILVLFLISLFSLILYELYF